MLRLIIESISNDFGTYYYQGEVFTGIAFTINGCDIESALQIKGGKANGLYLSEYFSNQHDLLKIHSGCLEPEEDEAVVDFLINKYDNAKLEKFDLDIKRSEPILEFEGKTYSDEVKKCLRIWPQDNDSEGFFVAKIKKDGF